MFESHSVKRRTFVLEFEEISLDAIPVGKPLPCNIFIKDQSVYKPYENAGVIFTPAVKSMLQSHGLRSVYVYSNAVSAFSQQKRDSADEEADRAAKEVSEAYTKEKANVYCIDRRSLLPGAVVKFGIYVFKTDRGLLSFASAASPVRLPANADSMFKTDGDIVIGKNDMRAYREYLDDVYRLCSANDMKNMIARIAAVENVKMFFVDILNLVAKEGPHQVASSLDLVKRGTACLTPLINLIISDTTRAPSLLTPTPHNFYAYVHTVNVVILATALAVRIGWGQSEVLQVALAALLHDVGQGTLPNEIPDRQGKMSEKEFNVMRSHVATAESMLRGKIPQEIVTAISQHHERLDGSGYPGKLPSRGLHPFAKPLCIADSFDSLTSRTICRRGVKPFEALKILGREASGPDAAMIREFVKMMSGKSS